jgi:Ala-tRNA(Pro) deacylase
MQESDLYRLLDTLNIEFIKVEHPAFGAIEDYHQAGIEFPGQCVKNLFLKNRKGNRFYLLILDELKTADLTALAGQIGEARLSFASEDKLMELMGLTPGAVTPFGLADDQEHRITVLLDDSMRQDDLLGFHPLVNSSTLCIHYADLLKYLGHTGHEPVMVHI